MSHEQHTPRREPSPTVGAAPPRLQLPRFQLATDAPTRQPARVAPAGYAAAPAVQHAPAVAVQHAPASAVEYAPTPAVQHAVAPPQHQAYPLAHHAVAPATSHVAHAAPAPSYAPPGAEFAPTATPTALQQPVAVVHQRVPATPSPAAHRTGPASPASTATRPASVSWERLDAPSGGGGLLTKISPAYMGVLLALVLVAMVVTSGPSAMKTPTAARLPAVAGGGTAVDPASLARSGVTPAAEGVAAAATPKAGAKAGTTGARAAGAATPRKARRAGARRMLRVGSARLDPAIRHGGIPSPAAAANLAIRGGGRAAAGSTGSVAFDGMPSAAASERLGPETLPFRPDDGVTLPRGAGERDAHAADTHYAPATLAMEEPVELPALTPGQSAARAELKHIESEHFGDGATMAGSSVGMF